jgi:hypothetical protein
MAPPMVCWPELMACLGGGKLSNPFDNDLFSWWDHHVPFIEDYPYIDIDITQDPDIIIPPER